MARAVAFLLLLSGAGAFKATQHAFRFSFSGTNRSNATGISKDIFDLENTVHQLLEEDATPTLASFAGQLKKIIEDDMKASVLKVKVALQEELDGHYTSGYDKCDQAMKGDGQVATKSSIFSSAASQHSTCRKEESEAQTAYSTCADEEATLKTAKEGACKVVADNNAVSNGNCAKSTGESYVTYTERLMKFYEAEVAKGKAAEKKCENTTAVHAAKSKACTDLKTVWTEKKAACDSEQDTMDAAGCQILASSQEVCKVYSDCYTSATSSFENDKRSVETQEVSIKNEWKSLLHLDCLLNVFSKSDSDKATAMSLCNSENYDEEANAALALSCPSPVPRTAKTCEEASDVLVAGRDSYKAKYYDLPSNAPAKTCEAECCATCDAFTCPDGYYLKDGAEKIFSELQDECCERSIFPGTKLLKTKADNDLMKTWLESSSLRGGTWVQCYQRSTRTADGQWFSKCAHKRNTVVILKNNMGKLIGGANIGGIWPSGSYAQHTRSWLFSLTTRQQYPFYRHPQHAVYGHHNYGPTFGGGHDLYLNLRESQNNNYCNLGHTYQCQSGGYGSSLCRNDFCGKYRNWVVEEMETYYFT